MWWIYLKLIIKTANICLSIVIAETLEKGVKYVQI